MIFSFLSVAINRAAFSFFASLNAFLIGKMLQAVASQSAAVPPFAITVTFRCDVTP
jgi:hypothetical protein